MNEVDDRTAFIAVKRPCFGYQTQRQIQLDETVDVDVGWRLKLGIDVFDGEQMELRCIGDQ